MERFFWSALTTSESSECAAEARLMMAGDAEDKFEKAGLKSSKVLMLIYEVALPHRPWWNVSRTLSIYVQLVASDIIRKPVKY